MSNIANLIKENRIKKGYTQRELAGLMGIPYQQIQRWEYGKFKPSIENLLKLDSVLKIDLINEIKKG